MKTLAFSAPFTSSLVLTVLLGSLVASCGGSNPEPASPAANVESASEAAPAEPAEPAEPAHATAPEAWSDELTMEQKGAFMAEHVMPAMKPVFAQASDFSCKTCHGPEQVESHAFAHPNQHLPRLEFKDGKLTSFETNPEVSKFMAEKVLPAMAQVMGREMRSETNPSGMGCNGCHAIDMK